MFHEVSIEVPYERLLCLVIKSVKLGSLQFKPENVMVILDDVFFMSKAELRAVCSGVRLVVSMIIQTRVTNSCESFT